MAKRIITTEFAEEDIKIENHLRPQLLKDYIGQQKVKDTLSIYIEAARQREEPLDHVLFYGPPGLGKTTLAGIIAQEMGVNIRITSGPAIEKPGDLAALLRSLGARAEWKGKTERENEGKRRTKPEKYFSEAGGISLP